jgi:putative ABC transport system permease protein
MLTLFLTRTTLLKEIEFSGGGGRPNLLFFDIQDDQVDGLKKATATENAPVLVHAPIVTMKIASVKGRKVDELLRYSRGRRDGTDAPAAPKEEKSTEPASATPEEKKAGDGKGPTAQRLPGWTLRREYRSTYRGKLEGSERLVSGTFVGKVEPGEAIVPISMEEGIVKEMGLRLGDEIEWDVQGVPIRSRLASVRAVEWRRLEPNFFVVFPEGVLEPAPKFHVAAVRAENSEHSARVQRAVVAEFPNVTAIDLALVMQTVDGIFTKVAFVIEFMAAFTVLTGIIVLAGAVLTGRFQRIRETVLLRTLGATQRQLVQIQIVEYAILGVLAAIVGCLLSVVGNALLAKFVFRITPSVPIGLLIVGAIAVCVVTVITGMLSGRGVTNHPPLEVLRQET